mgnify:CR=1 FL=1
MNTLFEPRECILKPRLFAHQRLAKPEKMPSENGVTFQTLSNLCCVFCIRTIDRMDILSTYTAISPSALRGRGARRSLWPLLLFRGFA